MKSYKQFLKEDDTLSKIQLLINPNTLEIKNFLRNALIIRGFVDSINNDLYVWEGSSHSHDEGMYNISKNLNVSYSDMIKNYKSGNIKYGVETIAEYPDIKTMGIAHIFPFNDIEMLEVKKWFKRAQLKNKFFDLVV